MIETKVYKQKEMEKYKSHIEYAKILWRDAAKKEFEKRGDIGSCTIGDGIAAYVIPPRCRKAQKINIISANEIAPCQGSCIYESVKNIPMDYLKSKGLDVIYNYGWLD